MFKQTSPTMRYAEALLAAMYHVHQRRNVMVSIAACVSCKHCRLKFIISQVFIL
jgi:ferredoxin-like protein FixX